MNTPHVRAWAQISARALTKNYNAVRSLLAPGCKMLAMVKANAYGHGLLPVAHHMAALGADYLGVTDIEEALALRADGIRAPILIMGITPPAHTALLVRENITQTVPDAALARAYGDEAQRAGQTLRVHVKLDTGMGRIGIFCADARTSSDELLAICRTPGLEIEGMYTHLSCADHGVPDDAEPFEYAAFTQSQIRHFMQMDTFLTQSGIKIPIKHCANSAAVLKYPQAHFDMVRPGIILYGLPPSGHVTLSPAFEPAMTLHAPIVQCRDIPAGTHVSYGGLFVANRPTRLAVVALGYADGYPRALTSRAHMLVHGQRMPVVGRICMDFAMLDVTDSSAPVCVGDDAVAFGQCDGQTLCAHEVASLVGTIGYELVTCLATRVPRLFS